MSPGVKFSISAAVVAVAIGYLAFLGAAQSWQYYLSVDEVIADEVPLRGHRLRVSGRVAGGSLWIRNDRRQATFDLAGNEGALHVACECSLPDNVAEDMDVVVEGQLQGRDFRANKLITRCASKYEPVDISKIGAEAVTELETRDLASQVRR